MSLEIIKLPLFYVDNTKNLPKEWNKRDRSLYDCVMFYIVKHELELHGFKITTTKSQWKRQHFIRGERKVIYSA